MKLTAMTSFSPNIISFEEYNQKIEIWEHPKIWRLEDEDCYSDYFLQELNQIKKVLKVFVSEGYSKRYISKYEFSFLRKLAYHFSKTKDIKESFRLANGGAGKLGFEFAKAQLKIFRKKFGRMPYIKDEKMYGIDRSCRKGSWKEFGIRSWNDLLREVFGKVNNEYNYYTGKKGLERAKDILVKFYRENGRIPELRDKGMGGFSGACFLGRYHDYGIDCWNDLLKEVFGKVNREHGIWVGLDGLDRAKEHLTQFYKENGRLPTSMDEGTSGIREACSLGYYRDYGINCWNDLMFQTFGKVNIRYGIWVGPDGLYHAKEHLTQFYTENGRIPKPKDEGMGGIVAACHEGKWKEFGINHWSDLLKDVFKEEYIGPNFYMGEKGLNYAKKEMLKFFNINARLPIIKDGLWGINTAIESRYWKKWNIKTWNDLLFYVFGKVNKEYGIWVGVDGLNRAKEQLTQFYKENGRLPTSKDKGMGGIITTSHRGKWKEFGINTWNELLQDLFGKVNHPMNLYKGKKALERAKRKLTQFYTENGRIPKPKDEGMGGISTACYKGNWKEYGINSWGDLKKLVF